MNTIQRNFFRLLRCGVFNTTETLEPMSVHKWDKLHQLSILHDVQPYAYKGLKKCKEQFFVNLTEAQWIQWAQVTEAQKNDEEEELLKPYKLTNPILNRQLQNILDDEQSDLNTRKMLIHIMEIVIHGYQKQMMNGKTIKEIAKIKMTLLILIIFIKVNKMMMILKKYMYQTKNQI